MKNKNLFLIVTKRWYEEIVNGRKRVEYREWTEFWHKRLGNKDLGYYNAATVEFQLGYSRRYPRLKFKISSIDVIKTPEEVKDTVKTDYCFAINFENP